MARNRPRAAASLLNTLATTGLLALGLVACVGASPEVALDDPELVEGRSVYAKSCASCHGASGGGGVGQKLSGGAAIETFPDIADQIDLVANGRNNMPAFGDRLTPEQQQAVARYIREIL